MSLVNVNNKAGEMELRFVFLYFLAPLNKTASVRMRVLKKIMGIALLMTIHRVIMTYAGPVALLYGAERVVPLNVVIRSKSGFHCRTRLSTFFLEESTINP